MSYLPTRIPASAPFDVVGLGQNAVDLLCVLPRHPEIAGKVRIRHQELQGGGQVATAMVACQRLGLRAAYIGKLGGDAFGELSKSSLAACGVDVSGVVVEPGVATQSAVILVDEPSGERTVLWSLDERLGLRPEELRREQVCSGRVLHLDVTSNPAAICAATWARAAGIPVCLDIDRVVDGADQLLALTDVCIAAESFTAELLGTTDPVAGLRALACRVPGFVCISLGRRGAIALLGDRVLESPGFRVPVVDTTGCGDVFHGAFIAGMLYGMDMPELLRFANAAAALKCRALGGRPGIPTRAEVEEFLRAHPVG